MHFTFHPVLSFVWVGRWWWWWWWWGSLWKWQWKFPFLVCCLFSECNTPKSEHSSQSRRQHCTCTNYSTLCNYECGEMVAHTTLSPNNEWSSLFYLVGMWVMTVHLISLRSDVFIFICTLLLLLCWTNCPFRGWNSSDRKDKFSFSALWMIKFI